MRKRQVRNGLRIILAALVLIIMTSFFHMQVARIFALSPSSEQFLYSQGIFWAAATGGYGVVVTVLGLIFASDRRDHGVRLLPVILMLLCSVALFFYLLIASVNSSLDELQQPPGKSISI